MPTVTFRRLLYPTIANLSGAVVFLHGRNRRDADIFRGDAKGGACEVSKRKGVVWPARSGSERRGYRLQATNFGYGTGEGSYMYPGVPTFGFKGPGTLNASLDDIPHF